MTQSIPINYVEFKAHDLKAVEIFYTQVFGWVFTSYGPTYIAFCNSGIEGGFEQTDLPISQGALVVLYHEDLLKVKALVLAFGGTLSRPFSIAESITLTPYVGVDYNLITKTTIAGATYSVSGLNGMGVSFGVHVTPLW